MIIIRNFKKDWIEMLKNELIDYWGVSEKELNSLIDNSHDDLGDDCLPLKYYDYIQRHIAPQKRIIKQANTFCCPSNLQENLQKFESKVKNGININNYLSKSTAKINAFDALLSDWGVFHFHLGEDNGEDFVKRTGELLFGVVTDDVFYMIGIYKHGSWGNKEIISIIDNNWPELIEKYQHKEAIDISCNFSGNEIITLRKNQINSVIKLDNGKIFGSMGYGITLSKKNVSIASRIKVNKMNQYLKEIDDWVSNNEMKLINLLLDKGFDDTEDIHAKLLIEKEYSIQFYQPNDNN